MLVLPNKTAKIWNRFLEENKVLVYKYIVKEVGKGIVKEKQRVDLFKLENDSMHAFVPKEKYLDTLREAIKVFVEQEEYESAAKANKIIVEYQINKLIKESKNVSE
jgi:ABC-type Zn uptake system ZnuABC Zn-binding protein ZnuA